MIRGEIEVYPYSGVITRIVEGSGMEEDSEVEVYRGEMDEHLRTPEEGSTLQTSSYVISIPRTQDENGVWRIPHKGDRIEMSRYGETLNFIVDNAEPSQLDGISIYATQQNW